MTIPAVRAFSDLFELLRYRAGADSGTANATAFTFLEDGENVSGTLTFAELDARARELAGHLQGLTSAGDRVLLVYPPGLDYIVAFWACVYAGVIAVPALPPANARTLPRLQLMAADAQPRVALTLDGIMTKVRQYDADSGGALAALAWLASDRLPADGTAWQPPSLHGQDIAFLQYTSGSTGAPKGVMVSHANILANTHTIHSAFPLGPGDVVVSWLPPHHDMGLIGKILFPVYTGSHCVQFPPAAFLLRPHRWLKALSDYRARVSAAPNFAYGLCVNKVTAEQKAALDLRSVEFLLNGAEMIRPATVAAFVAAFADCGLRPQALSPVYGLAEATLLVTSSEPVARAQAQATAISLSRAALATHRAEDTDNGEDVLQLVPVGRVPDGLHEVIVVDPVTLQPCAENAVGEIWIHGPSVAQGYWNRPAETAHAFGALAADGTRRYFRTGDLGFLRDGALHVTGRIKEMMIFNGRNVYPQDIEARVEQLDAAFRPNGCAAFSLEEGGNTQLVVVQEIEARRQAGVERLLDELRIMLAEQHGIVGLAAVVLIKAGHLPRTSSGKIERGRCRAMYLADQFTPLWQWRAEAVQAAEAVPYVAASTEVERTLQELWQEVLGVSQVGVNDNFFDLGGNSLVLTLLHERLAARFDSALSLSELFRYPTIAAQAAFLAGGDVGRRTLEAALAQRAAKRGDSAGAESAVAIIGMSGRFPGAASIDEFWDQLLAGTDTIARFTPEELRAAGVPEAVAADRNYVPAAALLDGVDRFDAEFFGFTPREAEITDPQHRLFLECSWHALEDAGYDPATHDGTIGVFAGASISAYLLRNLASRPELMEAVGELASLIGNDKDYLATRTSYKLNLKGPSVAVQSACSTSLVAVQMACQSLLAGDADMALAGGVSVRNWDRQGYLHGEGGILSADGRCRPFDAAASGTVFGSGVGVVVLKRLDRALADGDNIHAVIRGAGMNNDGADKVGFTAPGVAGQALAIAQAHAAAGVTADSIGYVEAHGTATPLGDPIEVAALTQAFRLSSERQQFCALGSVKGNVGHLDTAAGIAGLIKAVLVVKHGRIPASLHFTAPNPQIDFARSPFFVNAAASDWPAAATPRRAGVSSFGFGGTNVHMVIEQPPVREAAPAPATRQLVLLSGRSEAALADAGAALARFLRRHPETALADLAYTSQCGRRHFAHRRALACDTVEQAIAALGQASGGTVAATNPDVVFLFPGQGSQYVGMARDLYETEAVFRAELDACALQLQAPLGLDLRTLLFPADAQRDEAAALLKQTRYTQPALFAVSYALACQLGEWGVRPTAMLGHSIGEYVAACLAGVLSRDDALALVAERGRLIDALAPGRMLAVHASAATLQPMLAGQLWLAAVNGPALCSVAGSIEAIAALVPQLEAQGIDSQPLVTSHGFHSGLMEPMLESFATALRRVRLHAPRIPFLSNVTGTWITATQAVDPAYWVSHVREPVQFAACLATLAAGAQPLLLEVGPGRTLSALAAQQGGARVPVAIPTLPSAKAAGSARAAVLEAIGRLWQHGAAVDWLRLSGRRQRVSMPGYPFQRARYWVEPGTGQATAQTRPAVRCGELYAPSWVRSAPLASGQEGDGGIQLVFASEDGLAPAVVAALRTQGRVVLVTPAAAFGAIDADTFTLDPAAPAHYRQLFDTLAAQQRLPSAITHLWGMAAKPADRLDLELGMGSLMLLAQAFGQAGAALPLVLNVVASGVHDVDGSEELIPARAAALGPCQVIPLEYPQIRCRHIDIPAGSMNARLLHALAAELAAEPAEPVLALRGPHRWTRTCQLAARPSGQAPALRAGGHYLITGGLGGLGLAFADYLSTRVQAPRIVLVGRSPLPERATWDGYLDRHDSTDPLADTLERLLALERRGATVRYLSADITDAADVARLRDAVLVPAGQVDGIFHAAGVPGDGVIAARSAADWQRVLAPKVQGTELLADAFGGAALEFFLLCSSVAVFAPLIGQADYAAANAYLDTWAHRMRQRGVAATAVNWQLWRGAGMGGHLEAQLGDRAAALLAQALDPADAPALFDAVLANPAPQWLVSNVDPAELTQASAALNAVLAGGTPAAAGIAPRPALEVAYAAPNTELEMALATIWSELFGIAPIGIHDDFFALGGHSLLATQLMSKVRAAFAVDLPLRVLFEVPTVAALAGAVEAARGVDRAGAGGMPVALPRDGRPLPLSLSQQRMWFLDQFDPGNPIYHISAAVRLRGGVDRAELARALNALIARHEPLRTRFVTVDGTPMQVIEAERPLTLEVVDLSELPAAERDARAQWLAQDEAQRRFDLEHDALVRACLFHLDAATDVMVITLHHIVSDGWSMSVLVREIAALYGAGTATLAPLPFQYADFAQWQRQWLNGDVPARQLAYWRDQLAGAPELLALPTDRPRPAQRGNRGATLAFTVPAATTARLVALGQSTQSTLFMTLAAAFNVLLARYSGQEDICLGTLIAGRNRAELEPLIGFFVNTLVLRSQVDPDAPFTALLQQVRDTALAAYAHQDVSFEQLLEAINPPRNLSYSPLFQVMLVLQNTPTEEMALQGLTLEPLPLNSAAAATAKFDLTLEVQEKAGVLDAVFEYNIDLFEHATIAAMAQHFVTLLEAVVAAPERAVGDLPLLTAGQQDRLVHDWNDTAAEHPAASVQHLFAQQAAATPLRAAVRWQGGSLSYAELDARASRLAAQLAARGLGPEQLVGVCVERSADMIVAVLAVLKAGAAYVPLDPSYPADRLHYMADDAALALVLTQSHLRALFAERVATCCIDAWEDGDTSEAAVATADVSPRSLAYVIYTSGSTGRPKGVMVEHGQLVNLAWAQARKLRQHQCRVMLQFASLNFDMSVEEIFPALICGATLVIRPSHMLLPDAEFLALLREHDVDAVNLPTAFWHEWVSLLAAGRSHVPPAIRLVAVGGEKVSVEHYRQWEQHLRGRAGVWINAYGPTECTVNAATLELPFGAPCAGHDVVLGRPIANTRIYILDSRLHPVPVGVAGELYLGGSGVARGYLRRPELTAEKFVPDPFSPVVGARMYGTGDLARYLADGSIEYLGRIDHQVKIRGFRIELGEIETALDGHAAVKEAVVLAREDVVGDKRLVAYLTLQDGASATADALRAHLRTVLPEYMLPQAIVMLPAFPLTPNGKIDRKALPSPDLGAFAALHHEPPHAGAETVLAHIWQGLLRVDKVGRHDNFFDLGGHSLMIVQLLEHLRQSGWRSNLRDVFNSRSLAEMALVMVPDAVEGDTAPGNLIAPDCLTITPDMLPLARLEQAHIDTIVQTVPGGAGNVQDIYPLAPLQSGVLFHHRLSEQRDTYVLPALLAFDSRAHADAFLAALQIVIDRHDALRTAVVWRALAEPMQVVYRHAALPVEELAMEAGTDARARLEALMATPPRMDLERAPLLRAQLACDGAERWLVLLHIHHIVSDHVTLEIILGEVAAAMAGRADQLAATLPYRNYVAQSLAVAATDDAGSFFRARLADVVEPTLPYELADVHGDGSLLDEARTQVDGALAARVRRAAHDAGVSPAVVFHVAWAMVVGRCSGRDDVVFGTVLSGRLQSTAGADRIPGMFINTLPVRLRLHSDAQSVIEHARRELVELLRHEQASLAHAQRCSGIPAGATLFSAVLNYWQSAQREAIALPGVALLAAPERTNYPFMLSVDDVGDSFQLIVQTQRGVDPQSVGETMQAALAALVQAMATRSATAVAALAIQPSSEAKRYAGFNATAVSYPRDAGLHTLFAQQAARTPAAVALVHGDTSLTYAELDARSNQLAHYLQAQGAADRLVALCVERSAEMVVAMLATLKAGAAYVPLDPAYPRERLAYMLADSQPALVLTHGAGRQALADMTTGRMVDLHADAALWTDAPRAALDIEDDQSRLAYVIYTSGSTGQPKGVMLTHGNAVNFVCWARDAFSADQLARTLFATSLNFDLAVYECFVPLSVGGTVHVVDNALALLRETADVTLINTVPSAMEALVSGGAVPATAQAVNLAGEALKRSLVERIFATTAVAQVCNLYGPSETTTYSTWVSMSREEGFIRHIGRPVANTQIYILDSHGQPAPLGVAGELYIGGAGVARGYLNRPELTAERFVADPFNGGTMYRTGDLGRWLEDGNIEYLGRNDFQVKIRGFRIELGEIEARLAVCAGVRAAAVVAREDVADEKRLVAYVVTEPDVETAQLRAALSSQLADYMVPSAFVRLDALPLTPNGKLDRNALPAPGASVDADFEAPEGDIETALAQLWCELLHLPRVGRNSHFFELGGHSLLVMQMLPRVRATFAVDVSVRTMFEVPTVAGVARKIAQAQEAQQTARRAQQETLARQIEAMTPEQIAALLEAKRQGKTIPSQ